MSDSYLIAMVRLRLTIAIKILGSGYAFDPIFCGNGLHLPRYITLRCQILNRRLAIRFGPIRCPSIPVYVIYDNDVICHIAVLQFRAAAAWLVLGLGLGAMLRLGLTFQLVPGSGYS